MHPIGHELPPTVDQIAPRIRRFGLIAYDVCKRSFHHLPRVICPLGSPVPEGRTEAMRNGRDPQLLEQLRQPRVGELLPRALGKTSPTEVGPVALCDRPLHHGADALAELPRRGVPSGP